MAIKQSFSSRVTSVIIYVVLIFLSFVFLMPVWMVFVTSFVSEKERLTRGLLLLYPKALDFSAYKAILGRNSQIGHGYIVTISRLIVGTISSLIVTSMLAYSLSKKSLPHRTGLTFFIFFTSIFNPGLIPQFLIVKYTHIYNTFLCFILPSLVNAWWMLILRNFMMQIPESLEEAAIVDGATPPQILWKIYLPLSLPSIVTIGMFYGVWQWNAWFDGMIYITNNNLLPVQVILKNIIAASQTENLDLLSSEVPPPLESVKAAAIVVTTVPILCVYPFVQKYFVKGALVGGVKG